MAEKEKDDGLFSSLIRADVMLGVGALMVGVCALVISLYEARVIRSQQQTAIWPYIMVGTTNAGEQFALGIRNLGTGPAIMRSAKIAYGGEPLTTWLDMKKHVENPPGRIMSFPLSGNVYPAGFEGFIVSVPNTAEASRAHQFLYGLAYDLCYCSLLDECWRVRGVFGERGETRERIDEKCEPEDGEEFYQ